MGDVISLGGPNLDLTGDLGQELVIDFARFSENLISERAIRKKYRFDDETWTRLGSDETLVEKIEAEKVRRIRSGQQKRERAQQLVVKAPEVLGGIMSSTDSNDRHRIDACKALNDFAVGGTEAGAAQQQDRFIITINLGDGPGETLTFNKNRTPNGGPEDIDTNVVAAIATKKGDGGGNGEPL